MANLNLNLDVRTTTTREFLCGHTSIYCPVLGHVKTQIHLCWYEKGHKGKHYWEDYGATLLTTEDNLTTLPRTDGTDHG